MNPNFHKVHGLLGLYFKQCNKLQIIEWKKFSLSREKWWHLLLKLVCLFGICEFRIRSIGIRNTYVGRFLIVYFLLIFFQHFFLFKHFCLFWELSILIRKQKSIFSRSKKYGKFRETNSGFVDSRFVKTCDELVKRSLWLTMSWIQMLYVPCMEFQKE